MCGSSLSVRSDTVYACMLQRPDTRLLQLYQHGFFWLSIVHCSLWRRDLLRRIWKGWRRCRKRICIVDLLRRLVLSRDRRSMVPSVCLQGCLVVVHLGEVLLPLRCLVLHS